MGSPVNLAAFVQLDAAIPNFFTHECHTGADAFNEIVDHPLERDGGYVIVPDRPALGWISTKISWGNSLTNRGRLPAASMPMVLWLTEIATA